MKHNKLAASLFFTGLLLAGCGSSSGGGSEATATTTPTSTTPTSTTSTPATHEGRVITTSGQTINFKVTSEGFIFSGYEGKPVLLEFYGNTCPHCVNAIPSYNNLQAKYGDRVLILTVNDGNQYTTLYNAGLQAFASSHGMTYRTVSRENAGNLKTYAQELVSMSGVPHVVMINRNGVITSSKSGPSDAEVEAYILDVL